MISLGIQKAAGLPCDKVAMKRSILIVEDEQRIAQFLEKGLRKAGYETNIAADGDQAVSMFSSGEYELMLLDLGLPSKSGWDVLNELEMRGCKPDTVILVTSRDDTKDRLLARQHTVFEYIVKPFNFQYLLDLLQQVFQ